MSRYSKQQLADLWVQAGGSPKEANLMASIALAESGGRAHVINKIGATGLWQIYNGNGPVREALDPLRNAQIAVQKRRTQGLKAWEAYTNGSYRQFLGQPVSRETPGRVPSATGGTSRTVPVPGYDIQQAADPMARQKLALKSLLQKHDRGSALLRLGLLDPQPQQKLVNTTVGSITTTTGSGGQGSATALPADRVLRRANAISKQHLPYQWGGGHGSTAPGTPLDCSGAVSKVLGIDPRVSGAFEKWGSPGRGSRITVYANPTHVLMEIDGHFWGTSASNPGGGAGWIPRSQISPAYLARFRARHPAGG